MNVFAANRDRLLRHHPQVAAALDAAGDARGLDIEPGRRGEPTARLSGADGPGPYLHSRFDPRTEGQRLAASVPARSGYIVVWGPGLFYEVESLLERQNLRRILILEPRPELLRSALETRDLTVVLTDRRIRIRVGGDAEPTRAAAAVAESYLPALHGGFRVETARPRTAEAADSLAALDAAARSQLEDFAVQRRFGRRWLSNALRNLHTAPESALELPVGGAMVVAAAGPSLETELEQLDPRLPILSTDTAAPVLARRGVEPAAVVSLDCQQVSYHHFLAGRAAGSPRPGVPLVADLSSPPSAIRAGGAAVLSVTDYPLAALVSRDFPGLLRVDGGGGNVTQAAVSLAAALEASHIYVIGADLAYPDGKPYARDSYMYPYFRSRDSRLRPAEGLLYGVALADPATVSTREGGRRVYRPPKLESYRRRLAELADRLDTPVELGAPPAGAARRDTNRRRVELPPVAERRAWVADYARRLRSLTPPAAITAGDLDDTSPDERELWYSLLPTVAAFTGADLDVRAAPAAMEAARDWAVTRLSRLLDGARDTRT